MYEIHFVTDPSKDRSAEKTTFSGAELSDAIEHAKTLFATSQIDTRPKAPRAVGFVIFDNSGNTVHRWYES